MCSEYYKPTLRPPNIHNFPCSRKPLWGAILSLRELLCHAKVTYFEQPRSCWLPKAIHPGADISLDIPTLLFVQGPVKGSVKCVISDYAGKSKKGYAPYNPKKANQDSLLMHEDEASQSLLLCVMDGHGEFGDKVSQDLKKHWPAKL